MNDGHTPILTASIIKRLMFHTRVRHTHLMIVDRPPTTVLAAFTWHRADQQEPIDFVAEVERRFGHELECLITDCTHDWCLVHPQLVDHPRYYAEAAV